ncbi:MAG TPA: metallophosphoesterase [Thermoplasmata archaeon]|nr:metallophosphoesterase [Thermoplasmata archaeon]
MPDDLPTAGEIRALRPPDVDRLLDSLERTVPVRPGFVELPDRGFDEAIVFGDTHGDWRTSLEAERLFLAPTGGPRCLVGLGDYVDRPPADCPDGSVVNAVRLLALTAKYPERVFLLQGNHETVRRIPARPHSLDREVAELWGPDPTRYQRLLSLLERGPLAAASSSGAYFAHAGFPRGDLPAAWRRVFDDVEEARLLDLVWSDPEATRHPHGAAPPWNAQELTAFLARSGLRVFVRGHDPDLVGRPLYAGRCLTLHTTRVYERYGGVIVARVPLTTPVRTVLDLSVEHLATEGRKYDADR